MGEQVNLYVIAIGLALAAAFLPQLSTGARWIIERARTINDNEEEESEEEDSEVDEDYNDLIALHVLRERGERNKDDRYMQGVKIIEQRFFVVSDDADEGDYNTSNIEAE